MGEVYFTVGEVYFTVGELYFTVQGSLFCSGGINFPHCKTVGEEVIAGGVGPISEKSKRFETNIQEALMAMMEDSDEGSSSGSTSSTDSRPSGEWSEYTLPSEAESVHNDRPPLEDLMMPE